MTWSLATEEWFYLLFSATVLGLATLVGRRAIPIAGAVFVVAPLVARYLLVRADAPFDTGMRQIALFRLDAIAFGVLVAWALSRQTNILTGRRLPLLCLAGCILVCSAIDADHRLFTPMAPLLLSLTSILFALCLPAALNIRLTSKRLAAAVRWLSERSYCLYLIHLSIIDFVWQGAGRAHLPVVLCTPVTLLLCAGLAELSFRYFETPILRLRPRQPRPAGEASPDHAAGVPDTGHPAPIGQPQLPSMAS